MSAFDPAAIAEAIAAADDQRTIITCDIAVVALLLYDTFLTLSQERQCIWRSSRTWVSRTLYVYIRYLPLLYNILNLGTLPPMSDVSCTVLYWFTYTVTIMSFLGPAAFTTLRIYALSQKNKALGAVALLLSSVPFLINATTAYQNPPVNLPAPDNCTVTDTESTGLYIGLSVASRGCLILADCLAVIVTWRQTRAANQLTKGTVWRASLEQVMWQNGNVYFCTLVSMNVVDMVLVILSITDLPGQGSYVLTFIDPVSSILNSRFLLALHETKARLEGSDVSMTSYSLHFGSGSDPRDTSPELPPYLGALGGPIYSFPDDEMETPDSVRSLRDGCVSGA